MAPRILLLPQLHYPRREVLIKVALRVARSQIKALFRPFYESCISEPPNQFLYVARADAAYRRRRISVDLSLDWTRAGRKHVVDASFGPVEAGDFPSDSLDSQLASVFTGR